MSRRKKQRRQRCRILLRYVRGIFCGGVASHGSLAGSFDCRSPSSQLGQARFFNGWWSRLYRLCCNPLCFLTTLTSNRPLWVLLYSMVRSAPESKAHGSGITQVCQGRGVLHKRRLARTDLDGIRGSVRPHLVQVMLGQHQCDCS